MNKQDGSHSSGFWFVVGATSITMVVIVGLWIILLPTELEYSARKSENSQTWDNIKEDSRGISDDLNSTIDKVDNSFVFDQEASSVELEPDNQKKEEIDRFQLELERTTIEKANQIQP